EKQTQKTHNRFNDRKTLIFKHIDTHNGDASVGRGSYVKIWGLMKEPCLSCEKTTLSADIRLRKHDKAVRKETESRYFPLNMLN
ncbi:MAG: hypothetical protein SOY07_06805, partial [Bacteroidales bacterium]|nr:hypothetical protein [Bacteroidales bacterium]